jgi:hypothetical protein
MRSVPAELAEYLRRARAEGCPFIDAWIDGLQRTTTGRRDGRVWQEILSGTYESWRHAYELVPQTRAEAAAAVLAASALGDVEQVPDRGCECCGSDLDALGLSTKARYCSRRCLDEVTHERERAARATGAYIT